MSIRVVTVDHATIQRWFFKFTPLLERNLDNVRNALTNEGEWTQPTLK